MLANKMDLHCHSIESDGSFTIDELIEQAKKCELTHLAITNHDTIANLDVALKNACGIKIIPGIELSTYHNEESIHILGYFKNDDFNQPELIQFLNQQKINRYKRAVSMLDKLKKHYNIELDIKMFLDEKIITRVHIAKAISQKYQLTIPEIFAKILYDDSKAYVKVSKLSTAQGIALLKKNNALVFLAHPTLIKKNDFQEIMALGFDGIEAFYPKNKNDESIFINYAKKHQRLISAGSDFHYPNDPKHGELGSVFLEGNASVRFLEALYGGKK